MRSITLALILFPSFLLAQPTKEDYAIYSQYLKVFTESKKSKRIYFVINEFTTHNDDINDIANDLRKFHDDKAASSNIHFMFREFTPILTKDTSWIPLIARLGQKTTGKFVIENQFSPDLQTAIIDSLDYNKYFRHFKSSKQVEKNWKHFHEKYPMPSSLIELSEISSDGHRAAFYFSLKCGGLCGEGNLVLFSRENGEWKFLTIAHLSYD